MSFPLCFTATENNYTFLLERPIIWSCCTSTTVILQNYDCCSELQMTRVKIIRNGCTKCWLNHSVKLKTVSATSSFSSHLRQQIPLEVRQSKLRTGTCGAAGWMQPQTGSYLLYLWRDELPSGHKGAFLQRAHTAGWGVNSLFWGAAGGASPSR